VSYLSKVAYFDLPHLHLSPSYRVTPFEFRRYLESLPLLYGVVFILSFAVLIQYRCVTYMHTHTDTQIDTHTHTHTRRRHTMYIALA